MSVIVGHLQQVLGSMRVFPVDVDVIDRLRRAKVQRQRLVVGKTAAPAGAVVVVNGCRSGQVAPFRRRGGGADRRQHHFRRAGRQHRGAHGLSGDGRTGIAAAAASGQQQGQHQRQALS